MGVSNIPGPNIDPKWQGCYYKDSRKQEPYCVGIAIFEVGVVAGRLADTISTHPQARVL